MLDSMLNAHSHKMRSCRGSQLSTAHCAVVILPESGYFTKFELFELMLNVLVNRYGHVGMLPPIYGTFTQNKDVMT